MLVLSEQALNKVYPYRIPDLFLPQCKKNQGVVGVVSLTVYIIFQLELGVLL